MTRHTVCATINGAKVEKDVEPRISLGDFLRHEVGLTGTHLGCEHGVCGACTVNVDGFAVRSCLMLAVQADGSTIETVEALEKDGELSVLQQAFRRHHALQCGFCTPGILNSTHDFLSKHPSPTEDEVRDMISGHICRCTGYVGIVEAIMDAAQILRQPTAKPAGHAAGAVPVGQLVGQSIMRVEDDRFLRGKGGYVDDLHVEGMLHASVVRSQIAHGKIGRIDASAALALPGVVAVYTYADIVKWAKPIRARLASLPKFEMFLQLPLSGDNVRYVGEPVALVVAESPHIAEDAANLVEVEIEPLPAVMTWEDAEQGTTLLHKNAETNYSRVNVSKGDPDTAFATAPYTRKETFNIQRHTAVPMETRGLLAVWHEDRNHLELFGATKIPFFNRTLLAEMMNLPESAVDLIVNDVGGGFGVRGEFYPEDFLIPFAARTLKRPVKWIEDRREHMMATNHAREMVAEVEIACDRQGIILGIRGSVYVNIGAYARGTGGVAPSRAAQFLPGPYRIANVGCEVNAYVSNKTPSGTYRGPGRVGANFFRERLIDMVATDLGIDPLEMRRRNLITQAEMPYDIGRLVTYEPPAFYDTGDFHEPFEQAIAEIKWQERSANQGKLIDGRLHGLGMCCFVESSVGGNKEASKLILAEDGRLDLHVGTTSSGQGHETVLLQIAADALHLPTDAFRFHNGSTNVLSEGYGTFHSRSAVMGGGAVLDATAKFIEALKPYALRKLGLINSELTWVNGCFRSVEGDGLSVTTSEAIALAATTGDSIVGSGVFNHAADKPFSYGAHAAYVAVDPGTGRVSLLDYIAIEDAGRLINPMLAHGQTIGGIVQGLGGTFMEHLVYDEEGQLLTASLADYLLPVATDFPIVRGICLENYPALNNPLGAKGVGEGAVVAVAAAIGNAVNAALASYDVNVRNLPLSPLKVWELINNA